MSNERLSLAGEGYSVDEILEILASGNQEKIGDVSNFLFYFFYHEYYYHNKITAKLKDEQYRKKAFDIAHQKLMFNLCTKKYDPNISKLKSFFFTILSRKCIDQHRKMSRNSEKHKFIDVDNPKYIDYLRDQSEEIIDSISDKQDVKKIKLLIDTMSAICKQIFALIEKGYTTAMMAQRLEINIDTAKKRVYRCKGRLRELIKDQTNR